MTSEPDNLVFGADVLSRAILNETELAQFKAKSERFDYFDRETGITVVMYRHENRLILVDKIITP